MSPRSLTRLLGSLVSLIAAACGGGGEGGTNPPPPSPTFTVSLSATSLTIDQGGSGSITATIARSGGHSASISLSTEGVPAGITATFAPSDISASTTTATLNVSVAVTTAPGSYSFTARGQSSSGDPRTATVNITVMPKPAVAVALSAATATVQQGGSTSYTATVSRTNFTGAVAVAVTGAPAGTTTTVTANNDVHTIAVNVGAATAAGTYTLTTTASGAGITAVSATFSLTVTAAPPSILLAASPTAVTIVAGGASQASTIAITRVNFTGTVVVATQSGLPTNATATYNPTGPTVATSVTVTFAATAAATPGTYNVVIQGAGALATAGTVTIALTVAAPPASISLSATPAGLSVAQGAAGSTTINIARTNFAGAVTLAATGQPNGVTPTFTTSPTTGNSATLGLAVAATVATGSYQITITGSGTGLTSVSTVVTLTVTTAGSGSSITYAFCGGLQSIPIWFAYQSGTSGAWTPVTAGPNNTYQINVSGLGAVAWVVSPSANVFALSIHYGVVADLTAQGSSQCNNPGPFKSLSGTVSGFGATNSDIVSVSMGTAFAVPAPTFALPNFTLQGVPDGPRDLVGTRMAFNIANPAQPLILNKILLRRAVNLPNLGSLGTVDFNGAEAFDPDTKQITINGVAGGEAVNVSNTFFTNTQSFGGLGNFPMTGGNMVNIFTVPSAKTVAGDLQMISANASTTSGSLTTTLRSIAAIYRDPANQVVTLGPLLSTPTITVAAAAPYARLRTQLARQAEYESFWSINYSQAGISAQRSVAMTMTPGYMGGASAFDVTIPDFSGLAGWQNTWGPQTGVNTIWNSVGTGWILGTGGLVDGTVYRVAQRQGQLTP